MNNFRQRLGDFIRQKIRDPLIWLLKQGISPHKLALSVTFGILIGIIPVLGITTVLCAFVACFLRLNMVAIQLANWLVYPLQFLFYIPFLKTGEWIFENPEIPISVTSLVQMIRDDWLLSLQKFALAHLAGAGAWLLISIPLGVGIYFILVPAFKKLVPMSKKLRELSELEKP
ncbi:MAG: DUF2062 domain-containing protein [Bacteroidales bacterium]|nr:DUF2062 domain-containing protein [Bacteroidales bacterium]